MMTRSCRRSSGSATPAPETSRRPRPAVERDGEVVLLRDLRRALDEHRTHDVPADVEAEDRPRGLRSQLGSVGHLDSARLPTPARQHLSLDDDAASELACHGARLPGRRREPTAGDGDPEPREQLLALVLVEVHGPTVVTALRAPRRTPAQP